MHRPRYAYTTWISLLLYPCCQINSFSIDIVSIVYNLTQVDTNPEFQTSFVSEVLILSGHSSLELDSAFNRRGDTLEFRQNGIPSLMKLLPTLI